MLAWYHKITECNLLFPIAQNIITLKEVEDLQNIVIQNNDQEKH